MAITWGSTTLSVQAGTWSPLQGSSSLNEVELIPDPNNLDAICTVLQQGGRKRRRVSGVIMLTSMTDYNTLLGDMDNATTRTLDDDDTVNASYYIESLGAPNNPFSGYITADITFVEGV